MQIEKLDYWDVKDIPYPAGFLAKNYWFNYTFIDDNLRKSYLPFNN